MQWEYRYVRMVSSLTSPPTPAAPGNHTEYQQTTCTMQFSPCLFLHGSCPVFKHAERKRVQWVMLAKAFPRLVGRVKLVWTLCEFWWWKVQLEYGYVWTVVTTHFTISTTTTSSTSSTSSTTQPHRIPTTTCAMIFFPVFVLAWVLFCFTTCWKKQVRWIMLAKAFPRLVGTVKLVWTLC